jgi:hypothetical protein
MLPRVLLGDYRGGRGVQGCKWRVNDKITVVCDDWACLCGASLPKGGGRGAEIKEGLED